MTEEMLAVDILESWKLWCQTESEKEWKAPTRRRTPERRIKEVQERGYR